MGVGSAEEVLACLPMRSRGACTRTPGGTHLSGTTEGSSDVRSLQAGARENSNGLGGGRPAPLLCLTKQRSHVSLLGEEVEGKEEEQMAFCQSLQ